MMADIGREAVLERHQRADLASMDLATQLRAIEIAVEVAGGAAP